MTIAIQPAFAEEAATNEAAPEVNSPDKVVQNVCAACHGADGNSVITTNPKLAGQHPEYLVKQLSNFKDGSRANAVMSGMASTLSQEDMEGIAKYFSNQSIKLAKAKENGKGSLGEKIYRGGIAANKVPACAACHGVTGAGLPKQFPRLAGQHTDYTVQQLRTFRTGERANAPMMMTIAAKMSDAEMQAVADYIQGLR
ncbi:c-type cytochrome [Methylophilus sp. Leaf416]|uniref:c-type cytochrome n=1 Tax=unclassified Methylophilus TaxID=2630143 RepID=UPI002E10D232